MKVSRRNAGARNRVSVFVSKHVTALVFWRLIPRAMNNLVVIALFEAVEIVDSETGRALQKRHPAIDDLTVLGNDYLAVAQAINRGELVNFNRRKEGCYILFHENSVLLHGLYFD